MNNIRIVVVDCLAEQTQNSQIRKLFAEIVGLRFKGYGAEYPRTVLPVDMEDYFGTHVLVCQEAAGELKPVLCYKFTHLDRCEEFGRPFSALSLARAGGGDGYVQAVEEAMAGAARRGHQIGYCGSWTIDPEIRKNPEFTSYLRELVYTTHYFYQQDYGVEEMLIGGVLRFKTDKFQEAYGYRRLERDGKILGEFELKTLFAEPIVMLHVDTVTDFGRTVSIKHEALWQNRITFAPEARLNRPSRKKAA